MQILENTDSESLGHLANWKNLDVDPIDEGVEGYKDYSNRNFKQFENKVQALDRTAAL